MSHSKIHIYFDTSALIKRYYNENGTRLVDSAIEDPNNTVVINTLTFPETVSGIYGKIREGHITSTDAINIIASFYNEALTEFRISNLEEGLFGKAVDLIQKYGESRGIRTLDSIHLAKAKTMKPAPHEFWTADSTLADLAHSEGLTVVDPR